MSPSKTRTRTRANKPLPPIRRASGPARFLSACASRVRAGCGGLHKAVPAIRLAIQTKLAAGRPHDLYEREADAAAERVSIGRPALPVSPLAPPPSDASQPSHRPGGYSLLNWPPQSGLTCRVGSQAGMPVPLSGPQSGNNVKQASLPVQQTPFEKVAPARLEDALRQSRSAGEPLEKPIRAEMERHFGSDFSAVRIHRGSRAEHFNRALGSRAFTHGRHVYFGAGQYQPRERQGRGLLAHELTHVVQQNPGLRKGSGLPATPAPPSVQRLPGFITSRLASYARHISGYTLFTVIIGYDPLAGRSVAPTAENLLGGLMGLVPFGTALFDKLAELGIVGRAFNFVRGELARFDLSLERLERTVQNAWDEMDFIRLDPFAYNLGVLRRHFGRLLSDVRGFASSIASQVLEMIKEALMGALRAVANRLPGYSLFTKVLGRDPLSGESVARNTAQIIEEFLILIEQRDHARKMRETGSLQRAADWIDSQLALLNFSFSEIRSLFAQAWEAFSFRDVTDPVGAFNRTVNIFRPFVSRLFTFAYNVATTVLRFIKDALLSALSSFARRVPGFTLLTVILGRDPFTGQAVARNAVNLIRGFMEFVPGGEEKFRNLQESGAIDKAFQWLSGEIERLDLSMATILSLFQRAWQSLSIRDLIDPIGAFQRMAAIFGPPLRRIIRFAAAVGMKILEFVFEGVMGAGGARVLEALKRARATFLTIVRDPVGFVGNLIRAVVQGIRQFGANILRHLQTGLMGWLFGAMEGAGIQMPQTFDLKGILSLVLQILGLTYQRIRPRLVRLLGERRVSTLERTFEFLRLLVTEGPAAAWRKIVEFAGNIRDTIIGAIRNWVMTRIVQAAVTRLATMFNPAGAVIQAILAIYNTVMFFIERIQQILAVVESVINSISRIAAGNISSAANFIEQTMARTLPVVISFLARLIGLGGISAAIRRIIQRIRRPIDRAIDRVVNWIARQARRLVRGARAAAGRVAAGVARWWARRKTFRVGSESHSLFFEGERIMVASNNRMTIDQLRTQSEALAREAQLPDQTLAELRSLLGRAQSLSRNLERMRRQGNVSESAAADFESLRATVRSIMSTVRGNIQTAEFDQVVSQLGHSGISEMWGRFKTANKQSAAVASAENHFKSRVQAAHRDRSRLAEIWRELEADDRRGRGTPLRQLRDSARMGPNTRLSPTVAIATPRERIYYVRPANLGAAPLFLQLPNGEEAPLRQPGFYQVDEGGLFQDGPLRPYSGMSGDTFEPGSGNDRYGVAGHAEPKALGKLGNHLGRHRLAPQYDWGNGLVAGTRSVIDLTVDKPPCGGCGPRLGNFGADYPAFRINPSVPGS